MHRRWKSRRRHYLAFVFSSLVLITSNVVVMVCLPYIQFPCTSIVFLVGCCLLSSAGTELINRAFMLINSPPTSLQLNPPTMRRITCESSFSNKCLQSGPWNKPPYSSASFPLLPETHHSAPSCLHLLFPESGERREYSIAWEKTWQSPLETWFLVHHWQELVSCRDVMSGGCGEHAQKQCDLPHCSSCLFPLHVPRCASSSTVSVL